MIRFSFFAVAGILAFCYVTAMRSPLRTDPEDVCVPVARVGNILVLHEDVIEFQAALSPAPSFSQARKIVVETAFAARSSEVNWPRLGALDRWKLYRKWLRGGGRVSPSEFEYAVNVERIKESCSNEV